MRIHLRSYLPSDLGEVECLCDQVFRGDRVSPLAITRQFVSTPDHDPANLIVATNDDAFAGFILLATDPFETRVLWIVAFGVVPQFRGKGLGKTLISAAIARARESGCFELKVGAVPTRYLVPGVNQRDHTAAYGLLTKHFAFVNTATVWSMTRRTNDVPDKVQSVTDLQEHEIPDLRTFLLDNFHAAFWDYVGTSLRTEPKGSDHEPTILVTKRGAEILGMVHMRGNRFGPLAVSPAVQGQGLGGQLTFAALGRARDLGHDEIYFMLAEEKLVPFYRQLGFIERCSYSQLSRTLLNTTSTL